MCPTIGIPARAIAAIRLASATPAFELDGIGPAFLEEATGVGDGLLVADLVGHERQVGDTWAPGAPRRTALV